MSKYNLTLPKMGESVEEATIVNWLKNVGDNIKMDDFIVEVATWRKKTKIGKNCLIMAYSHIAHD